MKPARKKLQRPKKKAPLKKTTQVQAAELEALRRLTVRYRDEIEELEQSYEELRRDADFYREALRRASQGPCDKCKDSEQILVRARDLLIHEKIDAQLHGRDYATSARPGGWRLNGIGELQRIIEERLRK